MMSRRDLSFLPALAFLYGFAGPTYTFRYRLSISIETPESERSGSGVLQCTTYDNTVGLLAQGEWKRAGTVVQGEAVTVDLGERGLLFALLKGPNELEHAAYLPYEVFTRTGLLPKRYPIDKPNTEIIRENAQAVMSARGAVELETDELPLLVRFRDAADPKTVQQVNPDDAAASFGPGVKFGRAIMQITDDPVTERIKDRLPWLVDYYDRRLDGRRFETIDAPNRLANSLAAGSFSTRRDR